MTLQEALATATPSPGKNGLRLAVSQPEGVLIAVQTGKTVRVWHNEKQQWFRLPELGPAYDWKPMGGSRP